MAKLTVGAKVIANFFGIAERTIRSWVQKGMPRVADGVYNPNDCFEWWNEFFNTGSRKKGSGDGEDAESFEDVKERFWAAKAGNEELKFEKTKGKLVLKEEVEKEIAERCADLKISMRAYRFRLPPILEGKNREDMAQEIEKENRRVFSAFCREGTFFPKGIEEELERQEKKEAAARKKKAPKRGAK